MKKLLNNEIHFFEMDARNRRNPSGVLFEKGKTYSIIVEEVKEKWKDWMVPCSLSGWKPLFSFILPPIFRGAKYYALCGGIGDGYTHAFLIGQENMSFVAQTNGEFFVFANDYDSRWAYANNKGKLKIKLTMDI